MTEARIAFETRSDAQGAPVGRLMQHAKQIPVTIARLIEGSVLGSLRLTNKFPPLFIVGAPRTGSTVVTQHILNSLVFGYFPNAAKEHPRAPVTYTLMARVGHRYRPSYESAFGIIDGPFAPSDGWDIFHRWFPRYDQGTPVRVEKLHQLRTIVRVCEVIFRAPFANKNNANGLRIAHLHSLFPNAIFLHVTRDMASTVLSVLDAREKNHVKENEWWGAPPPEYDDRSFEDPLERVVYQTWGLNTIIEEALEAVPGSQWHRLEYESFCDDPDGIVEWLTRTYQGCGVHLRRRGTSTPSLRARRRSGDGDMTRRIEEILERLETGRRR